jgi:hypothetical protein
MPALGSSPANISGGRLALIPSLTDGDRAVCTSPDLWRQTRRVAAGPHSVLSACNCILGYSSCGRRPAHAALASEGAARRDCETSFSTSVCLSRERRRRKKGLRDFIQHLRMLVSRAKAPQGIGAVGPQQLTAKGSGSRGKHTCPSVQEDKASEGIRIGRYRCSSVATSRWSSTSTSFY